MDVFYTLVPPAAKDVKSDDEEAGEVKKRSARYRLLANSQPNVLQYPLDTHNRVDVRCDSRVQSLLQEGGVVKSARVGSMPEERGGLLLSS